MKKKSLVDTPYSDVGAMLDGSARKPLGEQAEQGSADQKPESDLP
jgi:hypothetical protein